MDIDEAVEIRNSPPGTHHVSLRYVAEQEIIERYLWLADETPLTVELIEQELGPIHSSDMGWWRILNADYPLPRKRGDQ